MSVRPISVKALFFILLALNAHASGELACGGESGVLEPSSEQNLRQTLRKNDYVSADGQVIFRRVTHPLDGDDTDEVEVILPQTPDQKSSKIDLRVIDRHNTRKMVAIKSLRVSPDHKKVLGLSPDRLVIWDLESNERVTLSTVAPIATKAMFLLGQAANFSGRGDSPTKISPKDYIDLPILDFVVNSASFRKDGQIELSGYGASHGISNSDYWVGFKTVTDPNNASLNTNNVRLLDLAEITYQDALIKANVSPNRVYLDDIRNLRSDADRNPWIHPKDIQITFGYPHPRSRERTSYLSSPLMLVTDSNRNSLTKLAHVELMSEHGDVRNVRVMGDGKITVLKDRRHSPRISDFSFYSGVDFQFIISQKHQLVAGANFGRYTPSFFSEIDLWNSQSGDHVGYIPIALLVERIQLQSEIRAANDSFRIMNLFFEKDAVQINIFYKSPDGVFHDAKLRISLTAMQKLTAASFSQGNDHISGLLSLITLVSDEKAAPFTLRP